MLLYCVLFYVCINLVICQLDEATLEYYKNLIPAEQARAFTYPLPKDSSAYKPNSPGIKVYGTFDNIIIGAGSAGAVIASRLTEDESREVLLLEAGGHESNFSDIPRMNIFLQGLEFNWNYNSTPQKHACLSMLNHECPYPRGKGLGGTSIINALMYVRGNKGDYDEWWRQGNPGWSYKDVLPYFIKSEDSKIDDPDVGFHGEGGYLSVENHEPEHPQLRAFLDANLETGRKILDYNGKEQLGASKSQTNTINGRRDSTGKAFLLPATNRTNLNVSTESLAIKILIGKHNKTAYGVLFSKNRQLYVAYANRDVILSAGSIGSPQLLMLSGIGPKNHLRDHDIDVIQSLSVGDNFHDHQTYYALHFATNHTEPVRTLEENIRDYFNNYGPFSFPGNSHGLGFYQTKLEIRPGLPDIELILVASNNTNNFLQKAYHYTDEAYSAVWQKVNPQHSFTLFVILLHPESRGTLRLKSKDPYEYPLIDPRFLSDPAGLDIERLYQGIQIAVDLVHKTKAFQKMNGKLIHLPLPECKKYEYLSRKYWYCQLKQLTFHIFHPVGTCAMGPNPRKGAVVNHKLKVHGIKNLRVADASIIPTITSGHTNAPAIMIGEKVSDMIKKET